MTVRRIAVIGGGPAGYAAALTAVRQGADVVLVERDTMGGTCTNRGCIPTKALLARSEAFASGGGEPPSEWRRMMTYKQGLVTGLARAQEETCRRAGVELIKGAASFNDPEILTVEVGHGSHRTIEADSFIVATGSSPATIPGVAPDGERVITSDDALRMERLPESLVIVGSGAVGAEFSFIFKRMGVAVTIVEGAGRLFPQEDPEVDDFFRRAFDRMGIPTVVGDPLAKARGTGGNATVVLDSGATIEAECVLLGVGRTLESHSLSLASAGVATGRRGEILVDARLATTNPRVFAAGDVTGKMLLAHLARLQGVRAARAALGQDVPPVDYGSVPWAIYTTPEIGSVGLTQESATARGIVARSAKGPLMESVRARIDRKTDGFIKLVEGSDGKLIGGTVVGPNASELVHQIALAVRAGMRAGDLAEFPFAHPSVSELIQDIALKLD